jgi:transcription elongation factor GreA
MSETTEMTAEGLAALEAEIQELETVQRTRIAQEIKTAREYGDLKENAEYHAAKEAQSHLETRILLLRDRVTRAVVVEKTTGSEAIGFGSVVEILDLESERSNRYTIVSAMEARAADGLLSVESPVASALRGRRVGDVASVTTPRGVRRLRIVSVE